MKKQLNLHKLFVTFALLLTASWSFAGTGDGEKKKTYSKSYPVSATDRIAISNQFGQVKIVTWNKMEAKVEVTITVNDKSDDNAQDVLDGIHIENGKNSEGVFFKTHFPEGDHSTRRTDTHTETHTDGQNDKGDKDGDKDKEKGKNKAAKKYSGMDVDYIVYMPAGNPLKLNNQFGKTIVPDLSGPVDIMEKFGELVTGKLSNVQTIQVEFGSASLQSVANGKIVVKFSKADIHEMAGSVKTVFEFCEKITLPLTNDVTDFNLSNSYSTIDISVSHDFSGSFTIHTNFGEFHNKSTMVIKEDEDEDDHLHRFDKDYSGKSGSGACKVNVKSQFGTIRLI